MSEQASPASGPPAPIMERVGRHTVIYGAGIVFGKAISFIMLPFYTRFLTPADYGVMQLLEMTLDVVTIMAGSQMAGGIHRFFHKAETREERDTVVTTALLMMGTSYTIVAILTALAAPLIARLVIGTSNGTLLVQVAAANLLMQALIIVSFAVLRLKERSVLYTVVTTAKLFVQMVLNIVFLAVYHLGVFGVFLGTLVSGLLFGPALGIYVLRGVPLRFSRSVARSLLRFGLPLVGTQIAAFFTTFGDRYFLRGAAGLTVVGLYALAYQFGFLLGTLGFQPFAMTWEPMRFEVAKRPDHHELCSRAFRLLNVLQCTMGVGIALFAPDFIRIMAAPAFHSAAVLVPVILVAYVIQSWAYFYELGIMVRERTEYITLATWIAAGIALLCYATLIPMFGAWGAAYATVLAFLARFIVTFVAAQRLWPLRIDWRPIARVIAASVAVSLAGIALPTMGIVPSVAIRLLFFGVYILLVLWLRVLTPGELRRLAALVTNVRARMGLANVGPGVT